MVHGVLTCFVQLDQTNETISQVETAQKTGYGNRERIVFDLKQTAEERDEAREKHQKALQVQAAREAKLNSFASRGLSFLVQIEVSIAESSPEAGQFALGFEFGMIGAVIGAGVSSYLSASAAQTVANAEAALEQKRKLAREMDSKLQNIEIDLKMFLVEKNGMVSKKGRASRDALEGEIRSAKLTWEVGLLHRNISETRFGKFWRCFLGLQTILVS